MVVACWEDDLEFHAGICGRLQRDVASYRIASLPKDWRENMNLKRQETGNEREQARGPSPTSVLFHPLNPATGKIGESNFLSNYNSNTNMNANASFLGKRRSGNRYKRRLSFVFIVVLAVLIVGIFHILSYLQVNQLHSMTSAADVLAFSYLFASGVLNGMNFGTLKAAQFESRPIVVVIQDSGRNALDVDYSSSNVQRTIELSKEQKHLLKHPVSSRDARHRKTDTFVEGNCVQSKDWQLTTFPACNSIHEYDMASKTGDDHDTVKLINHGYWRDVWKVNDVNKKEYVLKTIRYEHEYTERNFDRHRRDALAMERLTASENIVDIYGFCGNSGIFQYSQEGDVSSMIWGRHSKNYTSIEALYTAEQVAAGIAAAHTFDSEEFATLAHTDITPSQFVRIDGKFRLNDFNRCRCKFLLYFRFSKIDSLMLIQKQLFDGTRKIILHALITLVQIQASLEVQKNMQKATYKQKK